MDWQDWCVAAIVAIAVALVVMRSVARSHRKGGCDSCEAECPLRDTARRGRRCDDYRKK